MNECWSDNYTEKYRKIRVKIMTSLNMNRIFNRSNFGQCPKVHFSSILFRSLVSFFNLPSLFDFQFVKSLLPFSFFSCVHKIDVCFQDSLTSVYVSNIRLTTARIRLIAENSFLFVNEWHFYLQIIMGQFVSRRNHINLRYFEWDRIWYRGKWIIRN